MYKNKIAALIGAATKSDLEDKQDRLGFIPVRQGGGINQNDNTIYIGWSGDGLKVTVDSTDIGTISMNGHIHDFDFLESSNQIPVFGANGLEYFSINSTETSGATINTVPISDTWFHIIRMNHGDTNGYFTEVAFPLNQDVGIYYRMIASGNEGLPWRRICDEKCISTLETKVNNLESKFNNLFTQDGNTLTINY